MSSALEDYLTLEQAAAIVEERRGPDLLLRELHSLLDHLWDELDAGARALLSNPERTQGKISGPGG